MNECMVGTMVDGTCAECHAHTLGPCGERDCINTDGSYVCLGRAIEPVEQDGHFSAFTGVETVAGVVQPTTATIVGASVSTMVLTVLLGVGVGMGFRWYEKRRKSEQ